MHTISRLVLWLVGLTSLFLSFNIGAISALFWIQELMEKKGMQFDEPVFQKTLPMLFCANCLLIIIDLACAAYIIHGRPSKDPKYVPMLALCGMIITTICCVTLRFAS